MPSRTFLVCTASSVQAIGVALLLTASSPAGLGEMIFLFAALFGLLSQHPHYARTSVRTGAIIFNALAAFMAGVGVLAAVGGLLWAGFAGIPWLVCFVLMLVASIVTMACVTAQWQPDPARA